MSNAKRKSTLPRIRKSLHAEKPEAVTAERCAQSVFQTDEFDIRHCQQCHLGILVKSLHNISCSSRTMTTHCINKTDIAHNCPSRYAPPVSYSTNNVNMRADLSSLISKEDADSMRYDLSHSTTGPICESRQIKNDE